MYVVHTFPILYLGDLPRLLIAPLNQTCDTMLKGWQSKYRFSLYGHKKQLLLSQMDKFLEGFHIMDHTDNEKKIRNYADHPWVKDMAFQKPPNITLCYTVDVE